ncbi:MAG: ESX secretion-associated protein EspG [Nocardia sp.]|nr:ESX secretion-associated protein EspG [Nocardia sp.]
MSEVRDQLAVATGSDDPVAVDLNVDAALFLKDQVGIDDYPAALGVLPLLDDEADRRKVDAVIAEQLRAEGIYGDDGVHPAVAHWLRCLDRPDVELFARIVDYGENGEPIGVLRISLVRTGDTHVLAARYGDHIVIQPVFQPEGRTDAVVAALASALGPCPVVEFEPVTLLRTQIAELPDEPAAQRQAFVELGAPPHTAAVLSRLLADMVRRAEVVISEYHDGETPHPDICLSVFDSAAGRVVAVPRRAVDGAVWLTLGPGDDAALRTGVQALIDLLPGTNWFGTSRIS